MLVITIPAIEQFNEVTNEFVTTKEQSIQIEHSLVSISKWESKWKKPFLGKDKKTTEETLDYIKCMTITQNVPSIIYEFLSDEHVNSINAYIANDMTATTFNNKGKGNLEVITSEIIYYWMVALNIPFECQKWHLNRLLTLVNVCNIKNAPPKKMNKKEILNQNRSLNAQRKKQLNTRG